MSKTTFSSINYKFRVIKLGNTELIVKNGTGIYCVVFLFFFSSSPVHYVAIFSGLSFFGCLFWCSL